MNKCIIILLVSLMLFLSYSTFYDYRLYIVEFDNYTFRFGEISDEKFRNETFFDAHTSGGVTSNFYFKIKNKEIGGFIFTDNSDKFKHLAFSCDLKNCVEDLSFRVTIKNLFGKIVFELDSETLLKNDDPLVVVNKDLLFIKSVVDGNMIFHFLDLKKCEPGYSILRPCGFDSPVLD